MRRPGLGQDFIDGHTVPEALSVPLSRFGDDATEVAQVFGNGRRDLVGFAP